jgi:putative inorganic carbon (hco3(-)) transporter
VTISLLLAKISLVVVLATFLPLFLGIARWRRTLAVVLVVAAAAMCGFAAVRLQDLGDLGDVVDGRWALVGGGAVAVAIVVAALSYAAWRRPRWALPAMVAVMPIRLPVPLGDRTAYLLLPLYLMGLAVLIAEVVVRDRLRAPQTPAPQSAAGGLLRTRDQLRLALAAFIALAGLSVFWAGTGWGSAVIGVIWEQQLFAAALVELFAFFLPFALVLALTFRYVADGDALKRLLLTVVGSAAVMAIIGVLQYPTRLLIFNRTRLLADFHDGKGFRVNSLFWDPNMFSRFLIVGLILSVVLMIVAPLWRRRLIGVAFLLAGANVLTLSRSGWLALAVGLVVFGFVWLGRRRGAYVAGAAVLVLIAVGGLLVAARGVNVTRAKLSKPWGINHMVGGRLYLGQAALKMTADYPFGGVGLGGFSLAYPEYRNRHAYKNLTESHTTSLTVLAELGIPGFLVYLWVLVAAFWLAFRRRAGGSGAATAANVTDAPARAGPAPADTPPVAADPTDTSGDARRLSLLRAGFGAVLAALVTHSLLYNAFFEDPYVWLFFGLTLAAAYRLAGWRPHVSATP